MPLAVQVVFPLPLPGFDYLVPFDLEPGPLAGRVVVPWQGAIRVGLAVRLHEVAAARALELREVLCWLDDEPFLQAPTPELLRELAADSAVPEGLVLATFAPVGFRPDLDHRVRSVSGAQVPGVPGDCWLPAADVGEEVLELYRRQGLLRESVRERPRMVRRLKALKPADRGLAGPVRANQRTALAWLQEQEAVSSGAALARDAGVPESAVRALVAKGYAGYLEVEAPAPALSLPPAPYGLPPGSPVRLPAEDRLLLLGGLRRDRLAVLVRLLEQDLAAGRSALVLAPEQALAEEAAGLLGDRLAVLYYSSDYSDEQRARLWEELRAGGPVVLVGTHPILLAPLRRTGRIVLLEAGSESYKLLSGPRFFLPNAAALLAAALGVPLVETDPGPATELRATAGPGSLVELPPAGLRVHVADLSGSSNWPLGPDLIRVLGQVRDRERQALLLVPRRGFSAALGCRGCGWLAMCPNCDLPLRFYLRERRLRCHQCGVLRAPPDACPTCDGEELGPLRGAGTEWVAANLKQLLGGFPVVQVDRDAQEDVEPLLEGEPGVVVGTTRVFRLPLLPNLSLVGVTLVDTYLSLEDFRAEERTLRLLLQLAELAPQRRPLVVLQTFHSHHPLFAVLTAADPEQALRGFSERLLERRRRFGYPPFAHLARIQVTARHRSGAEAGAEELAGRLRTAGAGDWELIGPAPSGVSRVRGRFSYQVLIRAAERRRLRELVGTVSSGVRGVRIRIDVDPRDLAELVEG